MSERTVSHDTFVIERRFDAFARWWVEVLDALDRLIPEASPSPVAELRLRGRQRRRASGAHGSADESAAEDLPWRWGDES